MSGVALELPSVSYSSQPMLTAYPRSAPTPPDGNTGVK